MCGIAGLYSPGNCVDQTTTLKGLTEPLDHRGPDSEGYYSQLSDGIYLGHKRLRIVDLSPRGSQPMFNEDRTICIVFNGEIYNHSKLKENLMAAGHKFISDSDTEVIVHGFEQYGKDIFGMLDGDFAIALWNSRNKKLILARDKIGIKPLYYIYWNNTLCFSSEAKSFIDLNFQSWRKELDSSAVATLLGFQYYFDIEHTIIKGVQKVPAGSLLEFDSKGVVKQRYWTLEINPIAPSYSEAVRTTKNLLREAVIKRVMNCDVDQGILLSGGLDSSTVAALAANHLGHKKIKTFTSISDNKQDERQYARQVAKHLGADHTEILMDYKNILGDIDNIIKVYDDLNSFDPGIISTFLLSGLVKKHGISVVLVGEGADEALGGYSWYGLSKFPFNLVPSYIRSTMYYYILSRGIHGSVFNKNRFAFHNKLNSYKGSIYQKITQYEVSSQLPNHFNYKVDKGNMANAVEARLPYLDPTFVEYVFNLPDNYKLNGSYFNHWKSWEKRILRDIGREYLPENIVNRKKHGFMLSMDDTLRSNKKFIIHRITNNKELILNYLSQDYYDWLFMETGNHLLAKEKEFMTWRLFLFSVWYDYYFN